MRILAGTFKNRQLTVPKAGVRPTSGVLKEALFNICQQQIEGALFLDLYAGSGAVGLEALSRGAESATFVESNPYSLKALKKNIETLQAGASAHVLGGDVFLKLKTLEKQGKSFDLIFADPPYGDSTAHLVLFLKTSPVLREGGTLFIEEAKGEETSNELPVKSRRAFGDSTLIEYKK